VEIACTYCGGAIPIREDDALVACPFCAAALALEAGGAVPHLYMPARVPETELRLHLAKALAALEVAADPEIESAALVYVPFWRLARGLGRSRLRAASKAPAEELLEIPQLGGEALPFAPELAGRFEVVAPDAGLDDGPDGAALVHVPIYRAKYSVGGRVYEAFVEAIDGAAFADAWPSPPGSWKSAIYGAFAFVGFGAFFAEALLLPIRETLVAFAVTAGLLYAASRLWLRRRGG
jgi:hypothetical protein